MPSRTAQARLHANRSPRRHVEKTPTWPDLHQNAKQLATLECYRGESATLKLKICQILAIRILQICQILANPHGMLDFALASRARQILANPHGMLDFALA